MEYTTRELVEVFAVNNIKNCIRVRHFNTAQDFLWINYEYEFEDKLETAKQCFLIIDYITFVLNYLLNERTS